MEDSSLIENFLNGDKDSFEKLIIKYRVPAIYFAKRFIKDSYLAEDIVQESFADIYVHSERYNSKYSFKSYLYAIIKNKCVDYIRKNKSLPFEEIDSITNYTPEMEFLEKERNNIVLEKINQMKDDYRLAIYLVEYEQLSYKEIAKIMDKSLAQIKILIFRARKKLKNLLEGEV